MSGSAFAKQIWNLTGESREHAILQAIAEGHVPTWLSDKSLWRPISSELVVDGVLNKLVMRVSPDVISVGDNADFLRTPQFPEHVQGVAQSMNALMISRKIAKLIIAQADVMVPAYSFGEPRGSTQRYDESNQKIQDYLSARNSSPNTQLIAGQKKDVLIGPNLDGKKVAIWGETWGNPPQSYSTIHPNEYIDYSHGARLVAREATLNGAEVDLFYVFTSPQSSVLVSDQGPFVPVFPNKGLALSCRSDNRDGCAVAPVTIRPKIPTPQAPSTPATPAKTASPPEEDSRTSLYVTGAFALVAGVWVWKYN